MDTRDFSRKPMTETEKEGLLNEQADDTQCDLESSRIRCSRCSEEHKTRQRLLGKISLSSISVILNVVLLATCVFLTTYLHTHTPRQTCQDRAGLDSSSRAASPASPAVEIVWQDPWKIETPYSGAPGPDYSSLWSKLLEGTLLNVTEDEILESGERPSVKYETGGYAAGIGVGHDLHCMKRLKDFVWLEELRPEFRRDESAEYLSLRDHADHCVDTIRQQIQCHADTLLYPLEYVEHSRVSGKPAVSRVGQRQCVDFERLHDWMKSRTGNSSLFIKPDWLWSS